MGSGEAIELGARGEADVVLAHSPAAEEELMAAGKGASRRTVMHNDFVLVGPGDDPAGVRGDEPAAALAAIADAGAPFISRGDESGTHTFELGLWEDAGRGARPATGTRSPARAWARRCRSRTTRPRTPLTDRGTYLATDAARDLEVLVEGGADLLNVYHVIAVADDAGERVNAEGGEALADFLVAPARRTRSAPSASRSSASRSSCPDAGKTDGEIRAEA